MNKARTILTISATVALMSVSTAHSSATVAKSNWYDTYYQYRIPLTLEVEEAGWNAVPIDASTITAAINKNEELQFDPLCGDDHDVPRFRRGVDPTRRRNRGCTEITTRNQKLS